MIAPKNHPHEDQRLDAVKDTGLLDTIEEKEFDSITALVANICDVPISLVTLLDSKRNFLKSHHGVPFNESPRDISFCGHAILEQKQIFIVPDAREDIRFVNNPLVKEHNAIFYAGVPLLNQKQLPIGTLCVFDTKPRKLTEKQKHTLIALAFQVENLFETKRKNKELALLQNELELKNNDLKNFAGNISHDLKMPLARMIVTADMLKSKYDDVLDSKGVEYLNYLKQSALTLGEYITSTLEYYKEDVNQGKTSIKAFYFNDLIEEILDLLNIGDDCEVNFPEDNLMIESHRSVLKQIFLNLIGNSLKYNDKEKIIITLDNKETEDYYYFKVKDNGRGISKKNQKEIFTLFNASSEPDRNGNKGHGIGLATVKKLVTYLNGEISVKSDEGVNTSFQFSVKKIMLK
ncbi:GAF domain-containing sensor histidine kinase [Patiriisocius hiemis]|uniref:histidine kinase n=1 Tax=Patiriisocius hiemis TaxID=3075604 RepID=A0ABU2YAU9_9FLAO|nr:GAF domain-containing sensor histidine kinase [Constantimarinum sp. W242]MDT0554925.1 GAF domain-containing sensor histidine kinase [Constantimarinum sp. W242]